MNNNIGKGMLWKLFERFGVSAVQFILQIILANLLSPKYYGMLSIMIIFTTLANVFVQNGFNTALIQNKDVIEEDYSSVLWMSLLIAFIMYIMIFGFAPIIGRFYNIPEIVFPLRVLALMVFPGALNSVQLAKVSRELDFKKVFYSNIQGILFSGTLGVVLAYMGAGVWALVAQTLTNVVITCVVMRFTVKIKFQFTCNVKRLKNLFTFGWKLLVSSLIDTIYQDLRSLVIGKKYDSGTLGVYNRGKHFPQFIISAVNGAVQSVMLPAMSSEQDDSIRVKKIMRVSIITSAYIIFPMMAGLAAIAEPLVTILLKDEWLPCVPYLQIYCLVFAFYPIHTCNLQAINAMGRSDIFLKLEIIKKIIGVVLLIVAVLFFPSPIAIAMTGVFSTIISCFINAYPTKKLLCYSYLEQIKDLTPFFLTSISMFVMVSWVGTLGISVILKLILQVFVGILMYVFLSFVFNFEPYRLLKDYGMKKSRN